MGTFTYYPLSKPSACNSILLYFFIFFPPLLFFLYRYHVTHGNNQKDKKTHTVALTICEKRIKADATTHATSAFSFNKKKTQFSYRLRDDICLFSLRTRTNSTMLTITIITLTSFVIFSIFNFITLLTFLSIVFFLLV